MPVVIDEGTTNVKVSLFDKELNVKDMRKEKIRSFYPEPGWHEQDPEEIYRKTMLLIGKVLKEDVKFMGITNQRETTILWNPRTGRSYGNAIVWQCRRTADMIEKMREYEETVKNKTGLNMDAYFSATKIRWILDRIPNWKEKAKDGKIKFGTVDSYLIWKLTGEHRTDVSNASRTMIFNIGKREWDEELLEVFKIPDDILPEVVDSNSNFGTAHLFGRNVEITGVLGDQQAALFGHGAMSRGDTKVTYGTGAFILVNEGGEIPIDKNLLTTIAWGIDGTSLPWM